MAPQRYTIAADIASPNPADTNAFAIGMISAASKVLSIFDMFSARDAAASSARIVCEVRGTSTAITAGTAVTPQNLVLAGPASSFTASTTPTGATLLAQPFVRLMHSGRGYGRWFSLNPDSNIYALANGGINGTLLCVQRSSSIAASNLVQVYILE